MTSKAENQKAQSQSLVLCWDHFSLRVTPIPVQMQSIEVPHVTVIDIQVGTSSFQHTDARKQIVLHQLYYLLTVLSKVLAKRFNFLQHQTWVKWQVGETPNFILESK